MADLEMSEPTHFVFDDNLREVPSNPEALRAHVDSLKALLKSESGPAERVRIITHANLGIRFTVQNKIRLAHVLQWGRKFDKSNELFESLMNRFEEWARPVFRRTKIIRSKNQPMLFFTNEFIRNLPGT